LKEKFEKNLQEVADKYQNTNLYLKNLEDTVDDDNLRELFAEYGTITSCKVCFEYRYPLICKRFPCSGYSLGPCSRLCGIQMVSAEALDSLLSNLLMMLPEL
jgi:hypothetical protein